MQSPFPGMDPFLEGRVWQTVHSGLIYRIALLLSDKVPEDLFVDTEVHTILVDKGGDTLAEMYPDIAVHNLRTVQQPQALNIDPSVTPTSSPATLVIDRFPVRVESIRVVEIASRRVVTAIEVISPVNKFGKEYEKYERKIADLQVGGVHVVEIDLLRRGKRRYAQTHRSLAPYCIQVFDAGEQRSSIWMCQLWEALPTIAIPLRYGENPIEVDLQHEVKMLYQERRLGKVINYQSEVPNPILSDSEKEFVDECLKSFSNTSSH